MEEIKEEDYKIMTEARIYDLEGEVRYLETKYQASQGDLEDMTKSRNYYMEKYNELIPNQKETHKSLHEINTFQCVDNELYLRGKDEMGEDFTLCFDAFNFLEWIDKEQIEYIKEQTIKYIQKK